MEIRKEADSKEVISEKQRLWGQKLEEVNEIKDGLGKGVDAGIKETVAAMHLLDIRTRQSCEGHLGHGEAAPWVDIQFPPEVREMSRKLAEMGETLDALDEGTDEFERVHEELAHVRNEERRLRAIELKKLLPYLEEFYRERNISYEQRLILNDRGRLTNQGGFFQAAEDNETRTQKLYEYQVEMGAFTEFLKQKFFSE